MRRPSVPLSTATRTLVNVLLVGLFARTIALTRNPPGFFGDEARLAELGWRYLHFSLGHEPFHYPVNFIIGVSEMPLFALFGPTELMARLTAALYGVLTIWLLYELVRSLFDEETALWAALLLAISPWHVHLSRVAMEFAPTLFWTLLGVYLLVRREPRFRDLGYAALALVASLFCYIGAWAYAPLALVASVIARRKELLALARANRRLTLGASLCAAAALVVLGALFRESAFRYFEWIRVGNERALGQRSFLALYADYFGIDFLFRTGDAGFEHQLIVRDSILGMGELYWIQLPFLLAGLLVALRDCRRRAGAALVLVLLVLYPLPGALSSQTPLATRTLPGVVPLTILTALGIREAIGLLQRSAYALGARGAMIVALFLGTVSFAHKMKDYEKRAAGYWGWQYGFGEAMRYFADHVTEYDAFMLSVEFNSPDRLLRFYEISRPCRKCRIVGSWHATGAHRSLYAMRPTQLRKLEMESPDTLNEEVGRIVSPGGETALVLVSVTRRD